MKRPTEKEIKLMAQNARNAYADYLKTSGNQRATIMDSFEYWIIEEAIRWNNENKN